MSTKGARTFWIGTKRRLGDVRGILERRKFLTLRRRFYDTLWSEAAAAVGAETQRLSNGFLQIKRGQLATFVNQSEIMLDSAIAAKLLLNKALTYQWLAAKGLRTPRSVACGLGDLQLAENFMLAQSGPVVVKPADGTGCGHGVTTQITDRTTLRAAAIHAAAFHPRLLIEEQLSGSSYRLLFLDGVFVDAVRRDPPVLTGDGHSSIRQLAQQENERRREGDEITALSPLIVDRECRNTLSQAGLTPASVPGNAERVSVKLAANENAASENHVVRDEVNPELIEICRKVAADFGIGLAGFDLISNDISLPLSKSATVFAEINTGPGLHHHYLVAEREKITPVAKIILNHAFTTKRGVFVL